MSVLGHGGVSNQTGRRGDTSWRSRGVSPARGRIRDAPQRALHAAAVLSNQSRRRIEQRRVTTQPTSPAHPLRTLESWAKGLPQNTVSAITPAARQSKVERFVQAADVMVRQSSGGVGYSTTQRPSPPRAAVPLQARHERRRVLHKSRAQGERRGCGLAESFRDRRGPVAAGNWHISCFLG